MTEAEETTDTNYENTDKENESDSVDTNVTKILSKSVEDAIDQFRKIREGDSKVLTEKEIAQVDKECEIIRNREIITKDLQHEPVEITSKDDRVITGPITLTRFEKARIMGARALQLSLGAPVFIKIPENATTSLDIAMEELEQRLIPISIRRVLPNGDFQNIPLYEFKNE